MWEEFDMDTLDKNFFSGASHSKSDGKTYVRRWYDDDPELAAIVSKLEYSTDEIRTKTAMMIIKIVIDKNITGMHYNNIDSLIDSIKAGYTDSRRSRWYDTNATTRTAIQMLHDLPSIERYNIALEIKQSQKYAGVFLI